MTPDERDLRRALAGRSGDVTPAFRARLAAALAEGRPTTDHRPALAAAAAFLLAIAAVAVVLLSRQATGPAPAPAGPEVSTPGPASGSRTSTPAPAPTWAVGPNPAPTILVSPISMPTFAQFEAPSDRVLWAFVGGAELFRSTDQGATWEQRPLPQIQIEGVAFVDDHQGWLLAPGSPQTQCVVQVPTLWHTVDAGATWQRMDTSGIDGTSCKTVLAFVDAAHGFLVALDPNQPPVIYRTADGGRTWTASEPIPNPPGYTAQPGDLGLDLGPGQVRAFGSTLLASAGP
ncbi:MAG TPA: hypothetical protein VKF59_00495, partial [Candidatus Dormibacteraeota bacterium]|nr:hypothetical protein [Candidatus Dormibacteraeota bacterium]